MQFEVLVGQLLHSVAAHVVAPHPAWVDSRQPQFLCGPVDLSLANDAVQIQPCEVPVEGNHPSLGIRLCSSPEHGAGPSATLEAAQSLLPARIIDIRLWDSLGEGPVSAVDLLLESGVTLTVRHVYPPMSLGIDIWPEGRHEL